jgi:hypothetical protein
MAAKKGYQPPSRDEVLAMRAQKGQQMSGAALDAARRAQTIRDGLDRLPMLTDAIIEAFRQEDWKTLGYASFTAYTLAEFGERLNLTPAQRSVLVIAFVEAGMSKRAVAAAIGVDESTIRQDLKVAGNPAPREKSPLVNALRQSIEDAAHKSSASGAGVSPTAESEPRVGSPDGSDVEEPAALQVGGSSTQSQERTEDEDTPAGHPAPADPARGSSPRSGQLGPDAASDVVPDAAPPAQGSRRR